MKALAYEMNLAGRSLLRVPGFAATVILTLALTLGALITVFNLNHLMLGKPLPYPEADELMVTHQQFETDGVTESGHQTAAGMMLWYQQQQVFDEMALVYDGMENLSSHAEQPHLVVNYVTPEYFSLLRPGMQLGRTMSAAEGEGSHQPVVVLSHRTWQTWFNGQADIIGRQIQMGDEGFRVIGVLDEKFLPPQLTGEEIADLWMPWDYQPMDTRDWGSQTSSLSGFGKLKPGVGLVQASSSLSQQIASGYNASDEARKYPSQAAVDLQPLKTVIVGDSQRVALLLMAGVVALVLIAATNVTNLFLSRAAQKQRTLAIQAALGAKPGHLFTAMFAESLLLCGIAGLLSLLVAGWGFVLLQQAGAEQLPRLAELGLDSVTLGFTLAVVLVLAGIFARLASRGVDYEALQGQLQASGKGSGLQISTRTQQLLITAQVVLASVLLMAASVVVQQAMGPLLQPLGFRVEQVSYLQIDKPTGYTGMAEEDRLTREVHAKLSGLSQVQQVTRSLLPPIIRGRFRRDISDLAGQRLGSFSLNAVDGNYFELLEIPLVEGRSFTLTNSIADVRNEMLLSESMARALFPAGDAIGQRLDVGVDNPLEVVGIVRDYYNPAQRSDQEYQRFYTPYLPYRYPGFDIRLNEGAELSKQQLITALREVDPKLRVTIYKTHQQRYDDLVYRNKLAAGLALGLSLLALILAAAGIYGVLNYSTQMRRYEFGIHLALGAKTHRLIRMIINESLRPVVVGMGLSVILVLAGQWLLRRNMVLSAGVDWPTFAVAMPVILLVSLLACYLPARRLILDDPVKALRNE